MRHRYSRTVPKLLIFLGKHIVWDSSREKRAIKIGKLDDNDIILPDPRVSRNHAIIVKEGDTFYVYDNGSTNGTYLNNKRLPPKIRKELPAEGKIFISPYTLTCKILHKANLHTGTRVASQDEIAAENFDYGTMLGHSVPMIKVYDQIQKMAKEKEPILIRGESGTGKELVAWEIFTSGNRVDKPFVAINSGAIPKTLLLSELFGHEKGAFSGADARKIGKFEEAHGGTLFLDEIGDTLPETQVALLRVLQDGMFYRVGGKDAIRVDVRVLSATNQPLEQLISEGKFREDLYQRLSVYTIALPALRERGPDIELLTQYFLKKYGFEKLGFQPIMTPAALERLAAFPWPGNVRQLESVIKRTLLYKEDDAPIDIADLDLDDVRQPFLESILRNPTRPQFIKILEEVNWNTRKAAELLGVTPKAVQNKANRYGIKLRSIKKDGYLPEE